MNKNLWKSITILFFAIWTAGTWNTFPSTTGEELLVCLVINAVGLGITIRTIHSINNIEDANVAEEEQCN